MEYVYQPRIQSFGEFVPVASGLLPIKHEKEADALTEAINIIAEMAQAKWPKAHAGKVGTTARREYGEITLRATHENEIYGITIRIAQLIKCENPNAGADGEACPCEDHDGKK